MKINKKIVIGVILVAIVFSAGAFFLVFKEKLTNFQITKLSQEEAKPLNIIFKTVQEGSEQKIKIYLSAKKAVDLSAFQLKADLSPETFSQAPTLSTNLELKKQAWTFPIAKIEGKEVKIAGFRLGNSPYQVENRILFATISATGSQLSLSLDEANTIFYAADATTQIPYKVTSE